MADSSCHDPMTVMASVPQRPRCPDEMHVPQPSIPSRNGRQSRAARIHQGKTVSTAAKRASPAITRSNDGDEAPFRRLVTPSRVEHEIQRRIEQEPQRLAPHWEHDVGEPKANGTCHGDGTEPATEPQTPSPKKKPSVQAYAADPSSDGSTSESPVNSRGPTFFSKFANTHGRHRSLGSIVGSFSNSHNNTVQRSRRRPRLPARRPTRDNRVRFEGLSKSDCNGLNKDCDNGDDIRREIHVFDNIEFVATDANVRKQVWYSALELRAIRQASLDVVQKNREAAQQQQQQQQQQQRRRPRVPGRTSSGGIFKKLSRKSVEQHCESTDDFTSTEHYRDDSNSITEDDNDDAYLRGLEHYLEGETQRRQRIHDFVIMILQVQTEFRRKEMQDNLAEQLYQFCRSQSRGDRRRAQKLGEMDAAQIPELATTTTKETLFQRMGSPVSSWFSSSIRSLGTTSSWSAQSAASSVVTASTLSEHA